jgi:F-type H+-transporting ATPase subunit b
MKNVTDSFVSLGHWPSAGSFGFNTDILATNLINLSVVLGVLTFFERECVRVVYFKNRLGKTSCTFFILNKKKVKEGASSRELLLNKFEIIF